MNINLTWQFAMVNIIYIEKINVISRVSSWIDQSINCVLFLSAYTILFFPRIEQQWFNFLLARIKRAKRWKTSTDRNWIQITIMYYNYILLNIILIIIIIIINVILSPNVCMPHSALFTIHDAIFLFHFGGFFSFFFFLYIAINNDSL